MALNKVLSLDTGYEGAQDLLEQLDDTYVGSVSAASLSLDDEDFDTSALFDDELDEEEELLGPEDDFIFDEDVLPVDSGDSEPSRGGRRLLLIIPVLLLILLAALVLVIMNPFGGSQTPQITSTSVAQQSTPQETANTTQAAAPMLAVNPASDDTNTAVSEALTGFDVVDGSIGLMDTNLGNTLVIGVCGGSDMHSTLDGAMNALAGVSESIDSEINALGIVLIDCANGNQVLRAIAVPTDSAVAFNSGAVEQREYQAQWQPVA
jgi:hypothetical protein